MNDDSRVRVHIVGVVVTALFCSLLARLWFLESNTSSEAVAVGSQSVRTVLTSTSRGLIYDSEHRLMVGNRVSWAILADAELRAAPHDAAIRAVVPKLAALLQLTPNKLTEMLDAKRLGPLEPVILASEVPSDVRTRLVEGGAEFPHVQLTALDVREYSYAGVAPQVLGYLGQVNKDDLTKHPDYGNNEEIGRAGIEAVYESVLRGQPAAVKVAVDGRGVITGDPLSETLGKPGANVTLTLDAELQGFAEKSLQEGIDMARTEANEDFEKDFPGFSYRAPAGVVVVLDTTDGSVKALVSNPGYDNTQDIGKNFDNLSSKANNTPLLNRATTGLYAPGSTFKLVSAVATWKASIYSEFTPVDQGDGCIRVGDSFKKCSPDRGGGKVDFRQALTASSDMYFYQAGNQMWDLLQTGDTARGYAIQNTAREFGFGSKTGIDVGESAGTVPDEKWARELANVLYKGDPKKIEENNDWRRGDNISLAVGQSAWLVSPLQLANAYSALANGGTVWRPRLVQSINDVDGKAVANPAIQPVARSRVAMDDRLRSALLDGFFGVVNDEQDGTGYQAYRSFPKDQIKVWGKTGTAQVGAGIDKCIEQVNGSPNLDKCIGDTSWFVSMFAPPGSDQSHPRYVVLAMVEQGGRGGRIAAPITRQIIEHMNGLAITPIPRLTTAAVAGNKKG